MISHQTATNLKEVYAAVKGHMQKLADVEHAIGLLNWDKEIYLPKKGASFRSQQISTLAGIAHEIFTDPKFEEQLQIAKENKEELNDRERRNIELCSRDLERTKKLDKAFVMKRSKLVSECFHAWIEARKANDFNLFKGSLAELVAIKQEEAERFSYEDHPYDALLEEFEPGARTAQLDLLFSDVKSQLVDFVRSIRQKPQINDDFLRQHFQHQPQWDFGIEILKKIGYDFEAGRQDISTHPFTINFAPTDVRVTTRIDENNFGSMTWSCIHEGGHALYEQGMNQDEYGMPLGNFTSLGIHESQSRLWENNVGRSLPFWKAHYKGLQAQFPSQLDNVSLQQFYAGINKIEPSLIRVESDELHYHFHILIRYELEKALIDGSLNVNDLEEAWNEKYKAYLDVDIKEPIEGVLQDIHWSHGSIGYFPTYSLGSFYACQFFQQANKDIPGLKASVEAGDTAPLLDWLREKIHQYGRMWSAEDLCIRITGEPLNFKYFMEYARQKYGQLYNL